MSPTCVVFRWTAVAGPLLADYVARMQPKVILNHEKVALDPPIKACEI